MRRLRIVVAFTLLGCGRSSLVAPLVAPAAADDLAAPATPRDLALPDFAVPPDLAMPRDLAVPDLAVPRDLAVAADFAVAPDLAPPACPEPPSTCAGGWCWVFPVETATLRAVHGAARDDLWAVGDRGAVVHYDGAHWRPASVCSDRTLRAVHAAARDDVRAVGAGGVIVHFDGRAWTPEESGTSAELTGVWGEWAVGAAGTLLRRRGGGWSAESFAVVGDFSAIWGSATDDVWAAAGRRLLHFDGDHWQFVDGAPAAQLIWGSSSTEVWVAGSDGLWRWDGSLWTRLRLGNFDTSRALWGSGPSDIWILNTRVSCDIYYSGGECGAVFYQNLLHYTGSGPSAVSSVDPNLGLALWGVAGDDFWVVGDRGKAAHWDGARMDTGQLRSVGARAPDDVWAVGFETVTHFDGVDWSARVDPAFGDLTAVWGTPSTLWMARSDGIFTWEADRLVDAGLSGHWIALWGSSDLDLWAVGDQGAIARRDAGGWSLSPSGVDVTLRGVSGAGGVVWAVGDEGVILRNDGGGWQRSIAPQADASTRFHAVWAAAADDVYVASDHGFGKEPMIIHWKNGAWTGEQQGGNGFLAVAGRGDEVWASSYFGLLYHRELSGRWQLAVSPAGRVPLRALAATSTGFWAVGPFSALRTP